jgi:large subunit ribosomal protein L31e
VHDCAFKKKAPNAIKEVTKFAQHAMGVKDVRIDPKLNQEIWKLGVRGLPRRLRVRLERKVSWTRSGVFEMDHALLTLYIPCVSTLNQRNDDEDAKEKLYVQATPILGITNFHGLQTTVVDQE